MRMRTSPRSPWAATISPIMRRTWCGGVLGLRSVIDIEAGPQSVPGGRDSQHGPHRTRDPALATDDLPHLLRLDGQTHDDDLAVLVRIHADLGRIVHELPRDVLDQRL